MMGTLIKKDLRICRLPLVTGLLLLLGPYAIAVMITMNMPLWNDAASQTAWAILLAMGSFLSLTCSLPTLAMLAGNIIAVERSDRSAEFLAYLPPSRSQILLSKFIVLAGAIVVIYGLNLPLLWLANWLASDTDAMGMFTDNTFPIWYVTALNCVMVGVGWSCSACFESTGPAVGLAFASPLALQAAIQLTRYTTTLLDNWIFPSFYFGSCIGLGLVTFLAGTVYYLRRVGP
ncbi:MAG: ABC transporter permease [Pirellulales bacterium]|nr:ABC transporter permease [Pirellulales bacterium]